MGKRDCYVTLFNSAYMTRGLALYESLLNNVPDFCLYVIAFDDKCYRKLMELQLPNAVIISLDEFEDEELLNIKSGRSMAEYCWTCSSKSILYVLEHYKEEVCTYIDADIYFFSNPRVLLEELNDEDAVLITEHRYSDYCDQTATSGKYCVQFVTFKNTKRGLDVLNWWKDRCIESCHTDIEKGICGDQKYLDDWCERFQGVHELRHLGGGVAPWNVSQYCFERKSGEVILTEKTSGRQYPVIFYHFHNLKFFDKDVVQLTDSLYRVPDTALLHIYKQYIRETEKVCKKYSLCDEEQTWKKQLHYRDDDMDMLMHEKLYYHYSLFL